jgi:hypothetical protein
MRRVLAMYAALLHAVPLTPPGHNRSVKAAGLRTYTLDVPHSMSHDELKARYIEKMGQPLGTAFHHLVQDLAHLHLKWNEYLQLFGRGQERVDLLNRSAPLFFRIVQDTFWDDILLGICRLVDVDHRTLSVLRLKTQVSPELRDATASLVASALAASKFALKVRNVDIAHRNSAVATKAAPLPPSSRADVKSALAALDAVIDFVDHAYTQDEPRWWDHIHAPGGADAIVWSVERALKAEEDEISELRRRAPKSS